MRLSAEQEAKIAELAARKAAADRRWCILHEETKKVMRARGEPVREDFVNRAEYRKAAARYRRGFAAVAAV